MKKFSFGVIGSFLIGVLPSLVVALPAVESRTGDRSTRSSSSSSSSTSSNSFNINSDPSASGVSGSSNLHVGHGQGRVTEDRAARLTLKQIEALQQEVSELRGLVETQEHEIQKLKKSQQDLYLDLDKRLSDIKSGSGSLKKEEIKGAMKAGSKLKDVEEVSESGEVSESRKVSDIVLEKTKGTFQKAAVVSAVIPDKLVVVPDKFPASEAGVTQEQRNGAEKEPEKQSEKRSEKDQYQFAYELVQTKRYSEAIIAFQDYIREFPQGVEVPDANYWLGELYIVEWKSDKSRISLLDNAEQAFLNVTSHFPDHQKVSDSLLKLGTIEMEKNNFKAATQYFLDVKKQYPNSTAARIAENHLKKINT